MTDIIEKILNLEDLPSPPGVAVKFLECYGNPDVSIDEMATLIGADPVMAAKLLEYCNSSLFARECKATTIKQSLMVLGLRTVKTLTLSFSLTQIVGKDRPQFDYDHFWNKSVATGLLAKTIASRLGLDREQAFLQGLVLAIGQIGLVQFDCENYLGLIEESNANQVSLLELEKAELGINHLEVSAEMLRNWNFPASFIDVTFALGNDAIAEDEVQFQILHVLKLAQQISHSLFDPQINEEDLEVHAEMANDWFEFDEKQLKELFDEATESWKEFAGLLNFDSSNAVSFEQLERKARHKIMRNSLGLHAENTLMRTQNAELKLSASVDMLTGLKNRRAFDEEAAEAWDRASRLDWPLVVVMVDIDHFKSVNNTHGHAGGDAALVAVAETMSTSVRQYGTVFRFGGEEFVIVISKCDLKSAIPAVERVRKDVEELEIEIAGEILKVTASFGIGSWMPGTSSSIKRLLELADKNLYRAKKEGRNQVCSGLPSPVFPKGLGTDVLKLHTKSSQLNY